MTSYRVEIDGETVWEGDGDSYKVIPAEFRDRPADGQSAHHLYEETENGEQLFAVQVSIAEENG